jgi:hypothetical protein
MSYFKIKVISKLLIFTVLPFSLVSALPFDTGSGEVTIVPSSTLTTSNALDHTIAKRTQINEAIDPGQPATCSPPAFTSYTDAWFSTIASPLSSSVLLSSGGGTTLVPSLSQNASSNASPSNVDTSPVASSPDNPVETSIATNNLSIPLDTTTSLSQMTQQLGSLEIIASTPTNSLLTTQSPSITSTGASSSGQVTNLAVGPDSSDVSLGTSTRSVLPESAAASPVNVQLTSSLMGTTLSEVSLATQSSSSTLPTESSLSGQEINSTAVADSSSTSLGGAAQSSQLVSSTESSINGQATNPPSTETLSSGSSSFTTNTGAIAALSSTNVSLPDASDISPASANLSISTTTSIPAVNLSAASSTSLTASGAADGGSTNLSTPSQTSAVSFSNSSITLAASGAADDNSLNPSPNSTPAVVSSAISSTTLAASQAAISFPETSLPVLTDIPSATSNALPDGVSLLTLSSTVPEDQWIVTSVEGESSQETALIINPDDGSPALLIENWPNLPNPVEFHLPSLQIPCIRLVFGLKIGSCPADSGGSSSSGGEFNFHFNIVPRICCVQMIAVAITVTTRSRAAVTGPPVLLD